MSRAGGGRGAGLQGRGKILDRRIRGPRVRPVALLLAALALVIGLHARRVPLWVPPLALALGVWRLHLERLRRRLPGRAFLLLLALVGSVAVLASVPVPFGQDAALALLVLLTGVKLLEMRGERDRLVVVFLGFFLALTHFLYDQSIPSAALVAVVVVVLTAAWIDLGRTSEALPFGASMRLSLRMLAQAAPVAVSLFLFFPRISGPLWGLPADAEGSLTGLSDTMSPGSIGRIRLSDAVAFRVVFEDAPPAAAVQYWRGPVMEATDGTTWVVRTVGRGEGRASGRVGRATGRGADPVRYTVTLEPHGKRWLLALDLPTEAPEGATLAPDFAVLSRTAVTARRRYALRSRLTYNTGDLDPRERARNLQLPARVSPRVRALAEAWRTTGGSDADVVRRALAHFAKGQYVYTLAPPLLGRDPVDEFLFVTKRGFCEHYSGAFALLMRLAGIPARVVTGYQGGELNPIGGYWVVRQADAHAWAEVWRKGQGWVRVDPTSMVSPDRIELSVGDRAGAGVAVRFLRGSGRLPRALRGLRQAWDSVNNTWNQWVLGYDPERQYAVFNRLGFEDPGWRAVATALGLSVGLLLLLVGWETLRTRPPPVDPVRRCYNRFCERLSGRRLARLPHEGAAAYADRVCRERNDLERTVREITDLYLRLRYGRAPVPPEAMRLLRRRVSRFRP